MKRFLGLLVAIIAIGCPSRSVAQVRHHNDVLVLIQPGAAGPSVDPLTYWQPQWVLWPPAMNPVAGGRLLSILTGLDWVGRAEDYQFNPDHGGGWRAASFARIADSGYFARRNMNLKGRDVSLLVGDTGSATPSALRLALDPSGVPVLPFRLTDASWPSGHLLVGEARSWEDVSAIDRATDGRILVVEYPPPVESPWSRYWLRGSKWQQFGFKQATSDRAVSPVDPAVRIPGLVAARSLGRFVLYPAEFSKVALSSSSFAGANRYLHLQNRLGSLACFAGILLAGATLIWSIGLVGAERRSVFAPKLLSAVLLIPAITILAGAFARIWGPDAWVVWIGLSAFLVLVTLGALASLQRQWIPKASAELSVSVLNLVILLAFDPRWSFLSTVLAGQADSISYTALGAVFSALVVVVSSVHGVGKGWTWGARGLCLACVPLGLRSGAWWGLDGSALVFCVVAAILVGEQRLEGKWALFFALWPTSVICAIKTGWAWSPHGLIASSHSVGAINSALYVEFLTSPAVWVSVTIATWFFVFGPRFVIHQCRRMIDLDRRRGTLPVAALASLAFSALKPEFLPASITAAAAAACLLMSEAVQTM